MPSWAASAQKEAILDGNVGKVQAPDRNTTAAGMGPQAALRRANFKEMSELQMFEWAEQARLDAIIGCCRLSMASWKSGVRCYIAFAGRSCVVASSCGSHGV